MRRVAFLSLALSCFASCLGCESASANPTQRLASKLSSPAPGKTPLERYDESPSVAPTPPSTLVPPAPAVPALVNRSSPLGTNLSFFQDWTAEWSTVDVFKESREWISGSTSAWEINVPLALDEHGWVKSLKPGQIARTLMFWGEQPYPAGDYLVLYEGQGKLEYFGGVELLSQSPGRDVVRLDPKRGGLGIFIVATNPANYIRNMHVIHPGGSCKNDPTAWCKSDSECGMADRCVPFEQSYRERIFHPAFLTSLKPYSAVRFMNWMGTNDSQQKRWKDRPKADDARWTTRGVPVEVMVELANELGVDPWFCMPHGADDDYVEAFASYVRDHLERGLRAYVEHSNEVWNGIFGQHAYAAEKGAQLKGALPNDRFGQQMQWHAWRSKRIFEIWRHVFGDTKRIVRVLGAWSANAEVTERLLMFWDTHKSVDAIAIAPYFTHAGVTRSDSLAQAFAKLPKELERIRGEIAAHAALAKKYGVDLVAYEGGQHFVVYGPEASDTQLNGLLDAMNRDVRMKATYMKYLSYWREAGGHLFVHYKNIEGYSVHGRWGARESMLEPVERAPKLQAIIEWSKQNPRWW